MLSNLVRSYWSRKLKSRINQFESSGEFRLIQRSKEEKKEFRYYKNQRSEFNVSFKNGKGVEVTGKVNSIECLDDKEFHIRIYMVCESRFDYDINKEIAYNKVPEGKSFDMFISKEDYWYVVLLKERIQSFI